MNSGVIICIALAVTAAYGEVVHPTEWQQQKASEYGEECIKETGVNCEIITEAQKGNFIEDDGLKKFMLCFYQKAGIVDVDGHVTVEDAIFKLPPVVDQEEARQVLTTCIKQTGKDAADTVFKIYRCYRKNISTPTFIGQ